MRAALWLLALFGVAVAAALFAGNNQGTVTLYWPPYRIDLSLNMVVLLLVGSFAVAATGKPGTLYLDYFNSTQALHYLLAAGIALLALPRLSATHRRSALNGAHSRVCCRCITTAACANSGSL